LADTLLKLGQLKRAADAEDETARLGLYQHSRE
jgi:hypothetical protein